MILRISDKYIIRAFLYALLVCLAALISLFVVIDTFSNLSNIVADWRQSGQGILHLPLLVLEMNAVRLPLILYELAPVLTLSAAMFTVVRMRRANEITPLLASGVSIYRVLWPIFLMAIAVTIAQLIDREVLIPRFGAHIYEWDRIRDKTFREWRNRAMLEDGYGNVLFAGRYYIKLKKQENARITSYWPQGLRQPKEILNAQEALWVEAPSPGWMYSEGTDIEYDASGNVIQQVRFGPNGRFVPLVEDGANRANPDLVTDATPPRMETRELDVFYKPTLYMLEYAQQHGLRRDMALDINRRIAAPLTNFILLLVGLPFALRRDMKSPFLGAALAVGITGAYYAVGLLCENFALQGRFLTPLAGAWAPIIIFGPIGALLFDTMES